MKDREYSFLKLQEVVDDMSQALEGLAKSLNKSKMMIEVIKKSKQGEQFKEELNEMQVAFDAKSKEYNALLSHRNMLKELLQKHKDAAEVEKVVMEETLLTVFVAFNVIQEAELEDK